MKPTILIVEDQQGFRRIYRDALESEGYEVLVAEDGEKGLEMACSHRPNLILLDLGLPKMNGFQVLERIRADAVLDGVQVILFSVSGEEKQVQQALDMGADGFILKSGYTPRQAMDLIRDLLVPGESKDTRILHLQIASVP